MKDPFHLIDFYPFFLVLFTFLILFNVENCDTSASVSRKIVPITYIYCVVLYICQREEEKISIENSTYYLFWFYCINNYNKMFLFSDMSLPFDYWNLKKSVKLLLFYFISIFHIGNFLDFYLYRYLFSKL